MDISVREIRIGFRLGIYSFEDVQSWVDLNIAKSEEPSDTLVELSFSKSNDKHQIYSLLSSMPDSDENDESLIKVLSAIGERDLENVQVCRELAQRLYAYYVDRNYEVDARLTEIGFFDDGYDLAEQGIGDTIESWHQRFQEFVHAK